MNDNTVDNQMDEDVSAATETLAHFVEEKAEEHGLDAETVIDDLRHYAYLSETPQPVKQAFDTVSRHVVASTVYSMLDHYHDHPEQYRKGRNTVFKVDSHSAETELKSRVRRYLERDEQ